MTSTSGLAWRLDMAARALETGDVEALYFQADRCGFLAHLQPQKRDHWRRNELDFLLRAQSLEYRADLARRLLAEIPKSNE